MQAPAEQTSSRRDGAISGVIIDEATKAPIADAVVSLGALTGPTGFSRASQHQFSDTRGRFVFTGLPAAKGYTIEVKKSGYFDGRYGDPTFLPIAVADGQWVRNITVALQRPGSISGRVVDERGEPVIGVFVRVLGVFRIAGRDRFAVGPLTTTDDRGVYRVGQLAPGRYLAMVPSVRSSVPATVSPAALAGFDEATAAGRTIPAPAPMMDVGAGTMISLDGYPIPPPPVNGRAFTYPMAFSSGAELSPAAAVTLASGAERTGVDVRLDPQPAVRISGVVQGPLEALKGLSLRLLADGADDLGFGGEAGTSLVAPDGSFAFAGVPAGSYTIEASPHMSAYTTGDSGLFYGARLPTPPGLIGLGTMGGSISAAGVGFSSTTMTRAQNYWARTTVTAGPADVTGVVMTLRPPGSIRGRLVGEPHPSQPAAAEGPRFVSLESATGDPRLGRPQSVSNRTAPAGEFVIDGVLPGLYLFRSGSTGWSLKSVTVNGRDHTFTPLDTSTGESFSNVIVTMTTAVQTVDGVATDDAGAPAEGATVVVFPVEPAQWVNHGLSPARIRSARTPTTGAYRFRLLPAGDYYLVALPGSQSVAWDEPGFFQKAQRVATRVTVNPGETKTVGVKVTEVK